MKHIRLNIPFGFNKDKTWSFVYELIYINCYEVINDF